MLSANRRAHLVAVEQINGILGDFALSKDEISLGRSQNNDIVISDQSVSRVHARLMRRNGTYELSDLGSFNGTFLGKRKLTEPTMIAEGDEVRFGDIRYILRF
jgi:pSer/pThr/pTyr-binding forkhead associated (FHA) protein